MASRLNKGFSLIEVLITVGILAAAITFLFRAFTASLSSSRFSQNITLGCYLAEEKLWEIEYAQSKNLLLPEPTTRQLQNKDFSWKYEITDTAIANLQELKLSVSWQENMREKEYTLEFLTYLLKK